jgi:RHH-type proline utilization regulon transcriptional repressor/proline dehydrogenase/delta 1-pyrroline-5-carboxylate dehydrogenase
VINAGARNDIGKHIEEAASAGRLRKQLKVPGEGTFVPPSVIEVRGMEDMKREIFGPVLHVATFKAHEVDQIISDVNASGYGLTFCLHTRIDRRVEHFANNLNVGNIYINRNQIGAIVGSQPFGGEGLSGTGPKAGGPNYVRRFTRLPMHSARQAYASSAVDLTTVQAALNRLPQTPRRPLHEIEMAGPTGESNVLFLYPRGRVLCLGPTPEDATEQARLANERGCPALIVCPGMNQEGAISAFLSREDLTVLSGFDLVALWSDETDLARVRRALAKRNGPLIQLITDRDVADRCVLERHLCIDTTASGGNASLLAASARQR